MIIEQNINNKVDEIENNTLKKILKKAMKDLENKEYKKRYSGDYYVDSADTDWGS